MPPQASSAYHDHLEQSLLEQLRRDPQNLKARVELIELYFETDREREFLREAQALHDSLKGRLDSNEWRLVASIGRKFAPSSPLFFDTGGWRCRRTRSRRRRCAIAGWARARNMRRCSKTLPASTRSCARARRFCPNSTAS